MATKKARIHVNGIDGTTGQYLVPSLDPKKIAAIAKGMQMDPELTHWLKGVYQVAKGDALGLPLGVEPTDITQAGWAIVFHKDEDQAVKQALEPLIKHRRKKIGKKKTRVLEYCDGEDRADWLARYGAGAATVVPELVPLYVLLVGSPERIPFSFGHELSVEYAVGRLHFDTPAEYAAYAANVIDYETSASVPNCKEAVFFAPRHPGDGWTELCADLLVKPLADGTPAEEARPAQPGVAAAQKFEPRKIWGPGATKEALIDVLRPAKSAKPPAFLLTASHGMGWPKGHAEQVHAQGALLCQNWTGKGTISDKHYLTAAEIPADGWVQGMITFHVACYGAGTPSHDRFLHEKGKPPPAIANAPFFAALPKALLTHPKGGALACIGHVERIWGYSIVDALDKAQIDTFRNAMTGILAGQPVGYAMRDFSLRFAVLSTTLSSLLKKIDFGTDVPDEKLADAWTERNDAEAYVVLGDPAVRLRVQDLK
jgi:hypothetical protein